MLSPKAIKKNTKGRTTVTVACETDGVSLGLETRTLRVTQEKWKILREPRMYLGMAVEIAQCCLTLAQDTTMSHAYLNNHNATKNGSHSSPCDGVNADEEPWAFKDAFSKTGSKEWRR
ncbi:unnamed protein product [Dovyalis caffra]|uniref:Uncharacterized protein n=1 Tax=Dovyalis caffra TaxID=77055 RepID=A0AAV1SQ69_9ROSI|nr:unnamed protein product [Dovyalis caffra]